MAPFQPPQRSEQQGYTPPNVDSQKAKPGQFILGHLAITVPAVAAIPLFVLWGLYQFAHLSGRIT